ncbi:TPT-domain-containing protein [Amylocystis lapponica]|nr:TPT-domain-containing protein [Amylocystis lapponica]
MEHTWAATQHNAAGWTAFDAADEKRPRTRDTGWLASFGSSAMLPTYNDGLSEKHPWESRDSMFGDFALRWRRFTRSLLRRLPSPDAFWSQNGISRPGATDRLTTPVSKDIIPSVTTLRFVLLCTLWYTSSALSSNTGKTILTQFRYPITLTFIQFGFVAAYCLLFMTPVIQFSKFKRPTMAIFWCTLPMGVFQVGGHIFSSMAISRIPVSTVHTIKALSPLFTVLAYALFYRVRYTAKTYISLLPLTLGVMLVCSFDMSASNMIGLLCAFGSAIVFVTSNIFFKKVMPSGSTSQSAHKLDKLNLLFYSSSMAFLLMVPIWAYCDLPVLLATAADSAHVAHPSHGGQGTHAHSIVYAFLANGTVHFAQNIIAFIILAQTSPVTYSIASLIKRVAVICIAIVWFAQPVHPVQALGIALTFSGLYLYNRAKGDVEQGETRMRRVAAARDLMLPTTKTESSLMDGVSASHQPLTVDVSLGGTDEVGMTSASVYGRPPSNAHMHHTAAAHSPVAPPQRELPRAYSHSHPIPNLHIKITPPAKPNGSAASPVDSYPSPPPSLDSPPPMESVEAWFPSRHSMATGHPMPHSGLESHRAAIVA